MAESLLGELFRFRVARRDAGNGALGTVYFGERYIRVDDDLPKALRELLPDHPATAPTGAWGAFVIAAIARDLL